MNDINNLARIRAVYASLEELATEVVFVGGATVSLYRDRLVSESRVTDDVDIVVEVITYNEFAEIEEKLRKKGFKNDLTSHVISRYYVNGIIVDLMPTKGDILGFTNSWYADGFKNAILCKIDSETEIKIFDSVHFLSSKLEAFKNRGKNDGRISSDFEDIVYLLNSRSTIWLEIENAHPIVKDYIKNMFQELLINDYIYEWVSVHLDFSEQKRVNYIIEGINYIVKKLEL